MLNKQTNKQNQGHTVAVTVQLLAPQADIISDHAGVSVKAIQCGSGSLSQFVSTHLAGYLSSSLFDLISTLELSYFLSIIYYCLPFLQMFFQYYISYKITLKHNGNV